MFRATKQKFKMTRRHDALDSNPFKMIDKKDHHDHDKHDNKTMGNGKDLDDLDDLIKQL